MQEPAAKLTPKQERTIAALLAHPTVDGAAEALGINASTVYRWLQVPAFDTAYRQARREAVSVAIGRLQQVSGAMVGVLVQVAADKKIAPSVRVAAASKVIDLAIRAVELEDLAARIAALEERMGQV
jgi:hypothetical protein